LVTLRALSFAKGSQATKATIAIPTVTKGDHRSEMLRRIGTIRMKDFDDLKLRVIKAPIHPAIACCGTQWSNVVILENWN
jgi:hypothetical protein